MEDKNINIRFLLFLVFILGITNVITLWFLIPFVSNKQFAALNTDAVFTNLFINLIPNILATLLTSLIVLFVYKNKPTESNSLVIKRDYHFHNWEEHIKNARRIDIVANYFDKWLLKYQEEISDFLRKGGKIRIVMTHTDDINEINLILRRFPDMDKEDLFYKINQTKKILEECLKKNRIKQDNVVVYHYPIALHYPIVRIDDKLIVFSYFKYNNEEQFDAPSILLNIENDTYTRNFLAKEVEYLFENSQKIPLNI